MHLTALGYLWKKAGSYNYIVNNSFCRFFYCSVGSGEKEEKIQKEKKRRKIQNSLDKVIIKK